VFFKAFTDNNAELTIQKPAFTVKSFPANYFTHFIQRHCVSSPWKAKRNSR